MAIIHWSGAIIGLAIAIILILKKVNPVYALFGGAIIGGLIGGASLAQTTQAVIDGTSSVMGAVVYSIQTTGISGVFLAPISGILMAGATASTSTGALVAAGSFGKAILAMGVAPLNAAVMVHTGAIVIDHLPHGTFFHTTADCVKMDIKERMKLMPLESLIGGAMCIVATIIYGFLG